MMISSSGRLVFPPSLIQTPPSISAFTGKIRQRARRKSKVGNPPDAKRIRFMDMKALQPRAQIVKIQWVDTRVVDFPLRGGILSSRMAIFPRFCGPTILLLNSLQTICASFASYRSAVLRSYRPGAPEKDGGTE